MNRLAVVCFAMLLICCPVLMPVNAAVPNDAYITGYAAALLEHEFHVPNAGQRFSE
jgi:hypothetical protein